MTTTAALYAQGTAFLQAAGIDDPQLESAFFLCDILALSRSALYLEEREVGPAEEALFRTCLKRRAHGEPFAYIVGHQDFRGHDFLVSPAVLIPRPETEMVVEELLSLIPDPQTFSGTILDLGTGSGILPVSLGLELPQVTFVAVDISLAALAVARQNIQRHGCAQRISLVNADFLCAFGRQALFDFIVANPPYVKRSTFGTLQPDVVDHEPHLALDGGGEDGLALITSFAAAVQKYLRPHGWFFMEIGHDQKQEVLELFGSFSSFDHLTVLDDYAGLPRLLKARRSR